MPDVFLDATKPFIESGVLGALCVLLMLVVVFQYRSYRADIRACEDAHQKTRDALLAEIRSSAALGESIRDQQRATETAITAVLDLLKERDRR